MNGELEDTKQKSKTKVEGLQIIDLKLANAIKIGQSEQVYFNRKDFEINLHNNLIICITNKIRPGSNDKPETVYTSVMNAIYWRK